MNMPAFALKLLLAVASVCFGSPCPSSGFVTLSSHSVYAYVNCDTLISVYATNATNISLSFFNTTPLSLRFDGAYTTDCTFYVSQSSVDLLNVAITASVAVSNVSFLFVGVTSSPVQRAAGNFVNIVADVIDCVILDVRGGSLFTNLGKNYIEFANYDFNASGKLSGVWIRVADSALVTNSPTGFSFPCQQRICSNQDIVVLIYNSNITQPHGQFLSLSVADLSEKWLICNVSIVVRASFLRLGMPLLLLVSSNASQTLITATNISITLSNKTVCKGPVIFSMLNSYSSLSSLNVAVQSSSVNPEIYMNVSRPLVLIQYASSLASIVVLFDEVSAVLTFAALGISSVLSLDGPLTFVTQHNSVSTSNSYSIAGLGFLSGMFYFTMADVGILRDIVTVLVKDSSIATTAASWLFNPLALILLNKMTVLSSSGRLRVLILNSTILVGQTLGNDMCGIMSVTGITVAVASTSPLSAESVSLRISDASNITISCVAMSCIFNAMQTPLLSFTFIASGGSQLYVKSTFWLQRSPWTALVVGSFILLYINSTVVNAITTISNCTMTCGIVCQIAGMHWNSGPVYGTLLTASIGVNFPILSGSTQRNTTLFMSNVTVLGMPVTSDAAKVLDPRRPMLSFGSVNDSRIILIGTLHIRLSNFAGLVDSGGSGGKNSKNQLSFANCRKIYFYDDAGMLLTLNDVIQFDSDSSVNADSGLRISVMCNRTSTRSIEAATPTMTSSISPSIIAVPPAVVVKTVASRSLAHSVLVGAVSVALVVAGPMQATAVQMLRAQSLIAACPDDSGSDDAQPPPDFSSSPTQMYISPDSGAYDRGTVVGNSILLAAICVVAGLLLVLPLKRSAAELALPGLLFVPHAALVVPTVTSATSLLVGSDAGAPSKSDVLIAVLLGFGVFLLAPTAVLVIKSTVGFAARPVRVSLKNLKGNVLRRFVKWMYESITMYVSLPEASGFVERWEYSGITAYNANRQWFRVVELAIAVFTAVLAGLTGLGASWCRMLNFLATAAVFLLLGLILVLRPYGCRADRWSALTSSLLQCVTAVLGLLGADISLVCSFTQLAMSLLATAGYFTWMGFDGCGRLARLLKPELAVSSSSSSSSAVKYRRRMAALTDDDLRHLMEVYPSVVNASRDGAERRDGRAALKILIESICRSSSSSSVS